MMNPVGLIGDLLVVAGKKVDLPAEQLLLTAPLRGLETMLTELAKPTAVEEVAACAAWVVRNQPFPKYNREIAYDYMRLMLEEAEVHWPRPHEDALQIEDKLRALENDSLSEAKFVEWVCLRVATA